MTSEDCIKIIVDRLISLVDSDQLNATYNQSEDTISFYVNDISIGERPLLTLRVSDHRPEYQKYIRPDLTPPSSGMDTNVSIEFYKPRYNEKGKRIDNKVNNGVSIRQIESKVVPFVINSYSYTPKLLELADVDTIYNAVIKWINGGVGAQYEDPFKGTPKAAIPQSKEAVLKNNNQENITCNRNMNKKLIKLTDADLHRIVRESVNKTLNEDMGVKDTVNKIDKAYRLVKEACELLEVAYIRVVNSGGPYENPLGKKIKPIKEEVCRVSEKLDTLADEAERFIVFF